MAVVRIFVDGYNLIHAMCNLKHNPRYNQKNSLLHNWPELDAGKVRHSAAARDELVEQLTRYQDASGTPVTVFFDGSGKAKKGSPDEFARRVEVIYSGSGQTADDLIERATFRFKDYGEVLVVTDDFAERDMVISLGGTASSCGNFIRTMAAALEEIETDINNYNRRERRQFNRLPIR